MRLSDTLQVLLKTSLDRTVTLGQLVAEAEEQGFGVIGGLLTIPMLIPIPIPLAGFSTLFGVGLMVVGWQLAMGYHRLHLPAKLANIELSAQTSKQLLKYLTRVLHPIERIAKRRLTRVSQNVHLIRMLGLCMTWNAFLMGLPLPIPFTNLLPAYTILLFVIGLLEIDGWLILLGFAMTGITTVFFISISSVIWQLVRNFLQSFG